MANPLKEISFELGKEVFQRKLQELQEIHEEKKEGLEAQKKLDKQKNIERINYLNFVSIRYFQLSHYVKKIIISSIFLDFLLFLVPIGAITFFSTDTALILKRNCEYFLILMGLIVLYLNNFNFTSQTLKSGGTRTLTTMVVLILAFSIYYLFQVSSSFSLTDIIFQAVIIIFGIVPLIKGLKNIKSEELPQFNNLAKIAAFLLPMLVLRALHFIYVVAIISSSINYTVLALFTIGTIVIMLQIKNLALSKNTLV